MGVTLDSLKERLARGAPRRIEEPGTREAAVALLLAPGDRGLELLLIKRAEHPGDPWSGQMALPGGRRDAGDPDLLATAMREAREEVGIELQPGQVLGELDDLRPRALTLPPIVVRPFVFALPMGPTVIPSVEVALHLWVRLDELVAARPREIEIATVGRRLPAYVVGEHVVWGMTERILTPFFELGR
jgi:8-oxo-dGTP pyrophosphatase MutT (NUDIX family)